VTIDPNHPWLLLPHTLATNPEAIVALPVFSPADPNSSLVLKARTVNRRLPPDLAAHIAQQQAEASGGSAQIELPTHLVVGRLLLTVPADLAENLRGPVEDRHVAYLVVVRRDQYDAVKRQAETGIVLPDASTAKGLGIIKP
jgi:hypothetical protein